jgi:hypothetical protein
MSYCRDRSKSQHRPDGRRRTKETNLIEDLTELALVLHGEEDLLDVADVGKGVEVLLDDGGRAVKLEAEVTETLRDGSHLRRSDVTTDEDTRVGLGNAETVGGGEGGPVGFAEVGSEGGDFTGRGHLDTEVRVGTCETSPRDYREERGGQWRKASKERQRETHTEEP